MIIMTNCLSRYSNLYNIEKKSSYERVIIELAHSHIESAESVLLVKRISGQTAKKLLPDLHYKSGRSFLFFMEFYR